MPTATELAFTEQFSHLCEIATSRAWDLRKDGCTGFLLALPARDGSRFWLKVECDGFPCSPPAWQWYNPENSALNQKPDTPLGSGGYFHGSGRICAPWNRQAYQQVDPKGPHGDWQLSNWITNPKTGGCTTLSAMALRLAIELSSMRYQGRAG